MRFSDVSSPTPTGSTQGSQGPSPATTGGGGSGNLPDQPPLTQTSSGSSTPVPSVTTPVVLLDIDVFLQGAAVDTLTFDALPDGLMRDDLRSANLLPDTDPYGNGAIVTDPATVFADRGAQSVVDWVEIELRDPADNTSVLATQSGLLLRDGSVVSVDGVTPLNFITQGAGDYLIAVNHRNHLGVMTENPVTLALGTTTVDFTTASLDLFNGTTGISFDGNETWDLGNGSRALTAGNADNNNTVKYQGAANDQGTPFFEVLTHPDNTTFDPSFVVTNVYSNNDINLDGNVNMPAGATGDSDIDLLAHTVINHPTNALGLANYIIYEQLPESVPPVVIDLDGDGAEFTSVAEGIEFDADGDGVAEQVAWADSDDAVLVYDHQQDGDVTERSEIAFADYLDGAETDLEGLNHFDTDADGSLDADDTEFAKFKLWQDANGDGQVGDGELESLTDAGIESISLTSDGESYTAKGGDVTVHGETEVKYADGSTGIAADAEFDYSEILATSVTAADFDANSAEVSDVTSEDLYSSVQSGDLIEPSQQPIEVNTKDAGVAVIDQEPANASVPQTAQAAQAAAPAPAPVVPDDLTAAQANV